MFTVSNTGKQVSFHSLEFCERPTVAHSSAGTAYVRYERYGVPKIPKELLHSTVFLYRSIDAAKQSEDQGGTGFIVGMQTVSSSKVVAYIVSNWHVAVSKGFPVVRIPLIDGGFDFFDFDCSEWTFVPKYDIAVVEITLNPRRHIFSFIPDSAFLTENSRILLDIGPGDDVFMIGRFVQHGDAEGQPAVRFGNIRMNPAPIEQTNGFSAESYCLDLHSRTGFSGSPVFVYRIPSNDLAPDRKANAQTALDILNRKNLLCLLGIHWGQFPELWEIKEDKSLRYSADEVEPLLVGKNYVEGLSGMTCVLPSWSIMEVLNLPKLKSRREKINDDITEAERLSPKAESSSADNAMGDAALGKMLNTPPKPHDD